MKLKIIFMLKILLIILFITPNLMMSQVTKGDNPLEIERQLQQEFSKTLGDDLLKTGSSVPVGNAIIPEHYIVGPNDILSLSINPLQTYPITLQVSPSSSVLIPRFGEISIANLSLKAAKDSIERSLKKRNPNITVELTLTKSRLSLVSIKGNVIFPNSYIIPSTFQVSSAVEYANKINLTEISQTQYSIIRKYNEQNKDKFKTYSEGKIMPISKYYSRNILLLRNDGTSINVDIEKSKVTNNPAYNPYIKEGDEIIVPFELNDYPQISIAGEVNRPITLPYKEYDSISTLLKFGYGFTPNADLKNIKLYQGTQIINLQVDSLGNLLSPDAPIQAGAVIVVSSKHSKQSEQMGVISVYGEVQYPGVYLFQPNKSKVKDIIEMAGGFTAEAYLPLARIYRFNKNDEYQMDLSRLYNESFQYSNLTLEDTTRFLIDMNYPKNYVSCDFDLLFNKNDENNNVTLKAGDVIYIPKHPKQVYVFGQVKNPGYVEFVPNKPMEYYIQMAGGYADGAVKSRARIIRGRNLVWDKPGEGVTVNAGDQIYVPRDPDIPVWLEIQKWGAYAAIVGAAAALINILYSIYLNSTR